MMVQIYAAKLLWGRQFSGLSPSVVWEAINFSSSKTVPVTFWLLESLDNLPQDTQIVYLRCSWSTRFQTRMASHQHPLFDYHLAYVKLGHFGYVGAMGWSQSNLNGQGSATHIRTQMSRTDIHYSVLSLETCNSLSTSTDFSWIGDKRLRLPERLSVDFMISLNVAEVDELLASSWLFLLGL